MERDDFVQRELRPAFRRRTPARGRFVSFCFWWQQRTWKLPLGEVTHSKVNLRLSSLKVFERVLGCGNFMEVHVRPPPPLPGTHPPDCSAALCMAACTLQREALKGV